MEKTLNAVADNHAANRDRVLSQIGHCLRQGCVICIQHAEQLSPRFTKWEVWGASRCYGGNPQRLYSDLDRCREQHSDHHIRLNIEDYHFHSRFSFMIHSPEALA